MALDLKKFFTKQNEESGKWFDIEIAGEVFKVKLYGPNSTTATLANASFYKERDEILKEKDSEERAKKLEKAIIKKLAKVVGDIKDSDGNEVMFGDKPFSAENAVELLDEAPIVADEIYRLSQEAESFLEV